MKLQKEKLRRKERKQGKTLKKFLESSVIGTTFLLKLMEENQKSQHFQMEAGLELQVELGEEAGSNPFKNLKIRQSTTLEIFHLQLLDSTQTDPIAKGQLRTDDLTLEYIAKLVKGVEVLELT